MQKSYILLARTGVWKIRSIACGFSSIKVDFSDYPKSVISRINAVYMYVFFFYIRSFIFYKRSLCFSIKYRYRDILLKNINFLYHRLFSCNCTSYYVKMVSVTSAARYITSASSYHPRYQSKSSMYIRCLIPRNSAELVEAVSIEITISKNQEQAKKKKKTTTQKHTHA